MVLKLATVREAARRLRQARLPITVLAIVTSGVFYGSALAQQKAGSSRPASGPAPTSIQQPPKDITEPKDIDGLFRLMVDQRKEALFTEALSTAQKLLTLVEKQHGNSDKVYAHAISYVAQLYNDLNRAPEAETLLKRALAIYESDPASEAFVGAAINNLGFQYQRMGNIDEAERLYTRALQLHKEKLPADHPNIAVSLSNLGRVYRLQGRLTEAERAGREALTIREAKLKPDDPVIAESLENLALVLEMQDRLGDGEALLRRAVELRRKVQTASHPDLLTAIARLGQNLYRQRSFVEAQAFLAEVLQARQRVLPAGHELIAASLFEAALNDIGLRNGSDAKTRLTQALTIRLRAPVVNELAVAPIFTALADVALLREDYEEELDALRKGTEIYVAHATTHHLGRAHLFRHIAALWRRIRGGKASDAEQIFDDSFALAQQAHFASSAAASERLVRRLLSNNPLLGELVDKRSELRRKDLPNSLQPRPSSLPQGRLSQQRKSSPQQPDERFTEADREVRRKFPDYVDIAMPGSSPIADVASRLRADEALVQFQCGSDSCYAWLLTREQRAWKLLEITPQRLDQAISAIRAQLEPDEPGDSAGSRKTQAFDLALAYRLHGDLFGPFEGMLAGKTQLLVVASGALTSLPLQVLVTDRSDDPAPRSSQSGLNAAYASAAWLIKRHAISVLPSVGALKYRERKTSAARAGAPLVGFAVAPPGAPSAAPRLTHPVQGSRIATTEPRPVFAGPTQQVDPTLRGYWRYWAGSQINLEALKRDVSPLVGIDGDMRAVASAAGGRAADLHLGSRVTVKSIKAADLTPYRFMYFGTHALVAGEIRGTGEPGLVLTLPQQMSEEDMGLLTASDISQLKIGADLVLLPRVNTQSGDSPGADALAVLARGFMHAGARALVVSHWPNRQEESSRLLVRMVAAMKADRTLGPAEALRQVTVRQIGDPAFQAFAHPKVWAPYMVVGDGASLE